MQWETKVERQPTERHTLDHGPITLSIKPSEHEPLKYWQHLILSFGVNSEADIAECQATWPREALAKARAALDEFEANL